MKRSIFGYLTIGIFLTVTAAVANADEAKDEAIQKDRQQIEGTWQIIALEVSGNKSNDTDVNKLTVVNGSDGTWSLQSEGKEVSRGTSTIDPTQQPKTIDFKVTEGEGKDNQHLGIYELGKNTRRLCFAAAGKDRPTEFTSMTSNEQILVEFERETSE